MFLINDFFYHDVLINDYVYCFDDLSDILADIMGRSYLI